MNVQSSVSIRSHSCAGARVSAGARRKVRFFPAARLLPEQESLFKVNDHAQELQVAACVLWCCFSGNTRKAESARSVGEFGSQCSRGTNTLGDRRRAGSSWLARARAHHRSHVQWSSLRDPGDAQGAHMEPVLPHGARGASRACAHSCFDCLCQPEVGVRACERAESHRSCAGEGSCDTSGS